MALANYALEFIVLLFSHFRMRKCLIHMLRNYQTTYEYRNDLSPLVKFMKSHASLGE